MNEFWEQVTRTDLKSMEQPGWEYPGDKAISRRVDQKKRGKHSKRMVGRVALIAAVVALLGAGTVTAYQYWRMPKEAETYSGELMQVHESQTYPIPSGTDSRQTTAPADPQPGDDATGALDDQWFVSRAVEVLSTVNKMPVDAQQLTVTRQKHQYWDREEVMVTLAGDSGPIDATFDAQDGVLIHVTAFDQPYTQGEGLSEEQALALAREYYDSLPYARGYVYTDLTRWDEDMWMFSFSKPYEIEGQTVYSELEQVRITINPLNGHFQMSNCFYVPLLADHDPSQPAITMEQARQTVESWAGFPRNWKDYACTGELAIVLPSPGSLPSGAGGGTQGEENTLTEQVEEISGYVACAVTRPAWVFRYDGEWLPEGEPLGMADGGQIAVDLYTGEILCFDRVA